MFNLDTGLSVADVVLGVFGVLLTGFTIYIKWIQHKTQKQVLEIQKEQEERQKNELNSAVLSAELGPVEHGATLLTIRNTGKSDARQVLVYKNEKIIDSEMFPAHEDSTLGVDNV